MSTNSTPNNSPNAVQPLHNPSQAAHVVVPQAPLGAGNVANQAPGLGAKALLTKKMAKNHNPSFVSPTDNMMTPVSQKLAAARNKHFTKAKPVQLFAQKEEPSSETDTQENVSSQTKSESTMDIDDGSPF